MPTITSVFPSDEASAVPIGATIFAIFDEEIDETTIDRAFLVEGPDTDRWTGPDLQLFDREATPAPEFFLNSPDYKGLVSGTFTFVKLDSDGAVVTDATYSYGGPASFRHKVIFTPDEVLSPTTEYVIVLSGDELSTDTIRTGVASRTVFDVQLGANLGDGAANIYGGYTGTISDEFVVEITVLGDIGTSRYQWYRQSDPLTISTGTTSHNEVLLEDGVAITFSGDNFLVGDSFRAVVRPPHYMEDSFTWSFETGSGNIIAVPSTTSTSILGDVGSASVAATVIFDIEDSEPAHLSSQISLDTDEIIIDFTESVDPDTITQASVRVFIHPVRGAFSNNAVTNPGEIPKLLSLSNDNTRLTIRI